jgi:hypothetical protein
MAGAQRLTSIAAATAAADTAVFIARRPALFKSRPGRALANLGVLGGWSLLAVRALGEARPSRATQVLAGALFAANVVMLSAHLAHRVAKPRVFIGPALSAVVAGDVLRRR